MEKELISEQQGFGIHEDIDELISRHNVSKFVENL